MENNINSETKKLLNNLLQKYLDRRINKLEKKSKEEESVLKLINKESQKSILALEDYSHKVRKQIYLIRNKYVDERRNQNTIKNENSKTNEINKTNNDNNRININTNLFNNFNNENTTNNNLKKPDISHNEKEEKSKYKKKRNITKSPKSLKNLQIEEKMKTIQKSIKDLKAGFKSTKNFKKFPTQKIYLTMETTPKKKTKIKNILYSNSKKKIPQPNKKSPGKFSKTMTNFRINTQKNENFGNKKENKDNDNIMSELSKIGIEKDEDLRLAELKLDDDKKRDNIIEKQTSYEQLENQREKSPIKEQTINKEESLLINNMSNLNNELNNLISNEIKNDNNKNNENNIINNDNNNINIEKNNDINENKDILNDNKININNIEEFKNNKKNDKEKIDNNNNKINNIDNIIISDNKKNNIDYLLGDGSINFTLIEQEPKIEENDENNKTIDLNISGLSEQLTLEEKFQTHLDDIITYLDNRDIFNLLLINKECFKTIMNFLISKTEIKIDIFEEEITRVIEENKNIVNIDINNLKIKKFEFSSNSSRAISLLNTISVNNFIKLKNDFLNNKEINIIFNIYFIAEGKNEILYMNNDEKKWDYIYNYFKDYISKQTMGTYIEFSINGKIFDNNIINSLYKYSYKHLNIISPNHFQKINKDIAILVFIIKDMLEHLGILTDTKLNPEKEIILVNSRLKSNKEILDKLNEINNKIY